MSNDNHFHITLPSNVSMDIYPDNTAAQYTTKFKLPQRIELGEGDWRVSLKEIDAAIIHQPKV